MKDSVILNLVIGLGKTTIGTKHKEFNVTMHQVLKSVVGVGPIDNRTVRVLIVGCLSSKFSTKELVDLTRFAMKACCNIRNVRDGSLDTISRPFDLSIDSGHSVTVFGIIDWSGSSDIDDGSSSDRHGCFLLILLTLVVKRAAYIIVFPIKTAPWE